MDCPCWCHPASRPTSAVTVYTQDQLQTLYVEEYRKLCGLTPEQVSRTFSEPFVYDSWKIEVGKQTVLLIPYPVRESGGVWKERVFRMVL